MNVINRNEIKTVQLPTFHGAEVSAQDRQLSQAIAELSRRDGYFFLDDHGVIADSISATIEETARFYARPYPEKSEFQCSGSSQFLGYRGLGAERSLSHQGSEACEQYRIGNVVPNPSGSIDVDQDHFHAPFPKALDLFHAMVAVGDRLMQALTTGLGLDDGHFDQFMTAPLHRLGLNYYEVGAGKRIGNTVSYAMSSHIDHAIFTILAHDQPGLEVLSADGDWITVPVQPGGLFVFLGDYIQRWSNGQYRAAKHRVAEVKSNRVSIQYKHRPSSATVVAPLDLLIGPGTHAHYRPFDTGRQYQNLLQDLIQDDVSQSAET